MSEGAFLPLAGEHEHRSSLTQGYTHGHLVNTGVSIILLVYYPTLRAI